MILACVAGLWIARGAEQPDDPVVTRLAKAGLFAFGGVGFAGVTSAGETDYSVILARPNPEADLERLFAIGTPAAKCYALVGIRHFHPEKFEELATALAKSNRKVLTGHGCLMSREPVARLVDSIRAGGYQHWESGSQFAPRRAPR
jgi:hypothetical protein